MARLVSGSIELAAALDGPSPKTRVMADGVEVARVGRLWWASVFFGRGQRIVLPDGEKWRMGARSWRRYVCPAIHAPGGLKIATSAPGTENYYITTRDRGLLLNPAEAGGGRANRWLLADHEDLVAELTRRPFTAKLHEPLSLGAVLLARGLMAYGVLGEGDLMPSTSWST